ncbi:hypothetical protein ETU08_09110 [Apibacter muscae]|uniref:hypothetical protein n=1 Tax=Apibacter muscae TaxID=2509004 RepID=UPI0011AD9EAE|nr:hypothetical protein [Apibacter muscae]TWP28392.1 hypothetical protein ETU08_09110 [Apibacter muscae]
MQSTSFINCIESIGEKYPNIPYIQDDIQDATKTNLANSVERVKNNMRSAVHKSIEFRDKLRAQKKGDGAFEKSTGGKSPFDTIAEDGYRGGLEHIKQIQDQ